jgi:DNA mismatch repair protein MutL
MATIKQGILQDISPIGCPPGTTVIIENLFATVPARKKFLKSDKTEFRKITDFVSHFTISYPMIHFKLTHDKKVIFDMPKRVDSLERIRTIVGETTFQHLLPFSFSEGYITLSGYVGKPNSASSTPKQYIFINKRNISDKLISLAVKEAFGTLLPQAQSPTFLLFATLPTEAVDVNVHPRKEQVNFLNSQMVFDAIRLAITQTLSQHNLTISQVPWIDDIHVRKGETQSIAGQLLRNAVLPWNREEIGNSKTTAILQIHQTYILATAQEGLIVIDQHAAHERILYEQFAKSYEEKKKSQETSVLTTPITLTFSLQETQIFEEYKEQVTMGGFELEHFQGNSYVVRKIPKVFQGRNIEKILNEMLSEFAEDRTPKSIDTRTYRMLAYLSCRAAVKSGDVLSVQKMKAIIKQHQVLLTTLLTYFIILINCLCQHTTYFEREACLSEARAKRLRLYQSL